MAVQAQCRRCKHIVAADTADKLYKEVEDSECPEGGQHALGDFEEMEEMPDGVDWENFSGQTAL